MRLRAIALSSLIVTGFAAAAVAQDPVSGLAACARIADSAQRLVCYDNLAGRTVPLPERSAPAIVSPAKPAPPQEFGAEQLPKANAPEPGENDTITARVSEIALTQYGRLILFLDNGQIWRQLDADTQAFRKTAGASSATVRISRGLFGSYNLSFAGENALYKVRRIK